MYFLSMLDIENGEVTELKTLGYVSDKEEAEEKIRANDNAVFIKGEDSYYNYAIISETTSGFRVQINNVEWFKYNRTEQDVEIDTEEFGHEVIKRVDINIDQVNAPEGFEDYKPQILAEYSID